MKNIFNYDSKIKHLKQEGRTCGLYSLAMIINALRKDNSIGKINGQQLAKEIFELATDSSASISYIGELFTMASVTTLINKINNSNIAEINLTYEVVSFVSEIDLSKKLKHAIDDNSYILYPYTKNPRFNQKEMKILHWGVIDSYKDGYFVGQQSEGKSGRIFARNKKRPSMIIGKANELYKANTDISKAFEWETYFDNYNGCYEDFFSKWTNYILSPNRQLLTLFYEKLSENKNNIINKIVNVDMIGHFVIIKKVK